MSTTAQHDRAAGAPPAPPRPARREGWRRVAGGLRDALAGALARVPRPAIACALVALACALAWSLLVPPFQVPDENAHYAYVQQVAERGTLPRHVPPEGQLSPAEDTTLAALGFYQIVGEAQNPAPFSQLQQDRIEAAARAHLATRGSGDALSATNNPPLYYALAAVPYKLAGGSVLDRLAAMRVLSAFMSAITVLLVYLFLMELLPGSPWAWSAGALMAALQPLFSFISGGVNNDDLLYLSAAGLLWAIARMFRRGLIPANGALLGAFAGIGVVSKLTLLGMIPGAVLALALGLRRAWSASRGAALRGAAWALALGVLPLLCYVLLDRLAWRRGLIPGGIGSVPSAPGVVAHFNFGEEVRHIWQLFLPPLWMHHQFAYFPLWTTWFKGLVGRFGWLDYVFPRALYFVALAVFLSICVLAAGELVRGRRALARRAGELSVYALAVVGLCVEIGVQSYREMVQTAGTGHFEQARYLLPLLALYAGVVALAVRFAGRRWGPVLGAVLVVLAIGHELYAQAITVARYYA